MSNKTSGMVLDQEKLLSTLNEKDKLILRYAEEIAKLRVRVKRLEKRIEAMRVSIKRK